MSPKRFRLLFVALLVAFVAVSAGAADADALGRRGFWSWWNDGTRPGGKTSTTAAATTSAATTTGAGSTTTAKPVVTTSPNLASGNLSGAPSSVSLRGSRVDGFRGCPMMGADTVFHADVRKAPVHPRSSQYMATLGAGRGGRVMAGWGSTWDNTTYGIPINYARPDQPREDVVFNRGLSTSGPTIDDRPYAIPDFPLVEGMPQSPQFDRHLLVMQDGTCTMQELYNVANGTELPPTGLGDVFANGTYASLFGPTTWIAEAGVQYSLGTSRYWEKGQANASTLPMFPLMVRPDEIQKGYIDHMISAAIPRNLGRGYVWPARSGDGWGTDVNAVPMGTVFRLRSDVDLSSFSRDARVVLEAMQRHGVVIHDSGPEGTGGIGIAGVANGWEQVPGRSRMLDELNAVPVDWFDVVDVAPFAVDPATSWQVR